VSGKTIEGTCIVCRRQIAVRATKTGKPPVGAKVLRWYGGLKPSHLLVHHGYQRPGIGCIVGDCFAVGMPPHELSPVTAEEYRKFCRKCKLDQQAYKERLQAGEVDLLYRTEKVPVPTTAERMLWARSDPGWTEAEVAYRSTESDPKRQEVFVKLVAEAIVRCDQMISFYEMDIATMDEAIKTWKLDDLREREEPVPDPNRRRRRRFFRGGRL
jgi:hypothetical protein